MSLVRKDKVVQFRATAKSQDKLDVLKNRLKEKRIKPSIELLLNAILENITLTDFDKMIEKLATENDVISKLTKMYKEGKINKEMLDSLMNSRFSQTENTDN
ncbi:hypothetical protein [Moellerella wisconsensis]|uniref:Uncharacterized protein n=1 Tax=Moellerella wisconsensis TaxID=158849 RepID=A0ACD3YD65_9GAMM|nr:hypothetical protein [Moellerella wisconsensis]KLN95647.1 hypothetical protein VK86_14140 [Moellerella wisconsensis]UNH29312.1 hypothetical protein MNY64_17850 [Moellerella wisconsensis]UNH40988.1 hypothetical protein MNY70_18120 [Moellerella wisconsensis]WJW83849.1 hypothetical protein QU516_17625 [Moellerella wisconsensis]